MKKIPFCIPSIDMRELDALREVIEDNWLTEGKRVIEFQELFLRFSGGEYGRAVSSCTAALHLANILSGADKGKKIIVPVYTFAASANSIIYAGAEPVFIDSSWDNPNISIKELEKLDLDKDTIALINVNIGGIPCELDILRDFAKGHGIKMIQDCSHSIESEYKGKKLGEYGDFACYSFHTTKNITTADGGLLVYNDRSLQNQIEELIHHGMDNSGLAKYSSAKPWEYDIKRLGYKYNLTDLEASIGIAQLKKLEDNYKKRKRLYNLYSKILSDIPMIKILKPKAHCTASHHLMQIMINSENNPFMRDKIINRMYEKGITCAIHYKPLHMHTYYRDRFGFKAEDFPNSINIYNSVISLPIFPMLEESDIIYICDTLKNTLIEEKV